MSIFSKILTIFLATLFYAQAASGQAVDRYTKVANQLVELMNAGDYAGIQARFTREMAAALPPTKANDFFSGLATQYGKIEKFADATGKRSGEWVVFRLHCQRGELTMNIALDADGKIAGIYFPPPSEAVSETSGSEPQKLQTQLALPFKDRWLVFWGGDTRELNHHHDVPNQRFAFDLLGVGADGKTRRGDGTRNEDFYAFGRELLAPADGTVIEVIEGVRDNKPGSMNGFSALGNCVVIQHREDEVSVLAHLKQGSTLVKAGDKVKRGQLLGLCGNSGNTSEPHLHYHVQNSAIIQDGLGIKCIFRKVVLTSHGKAETRTNFSPAKGQIISPE